MYAGSQLLCGAQAERDALVPGGVYMLNSGAGCVHDEKPDPISVRGCTKALFAEGDDPAAEGFSFCQLWFNPGGLQDLACPARTRTPASRPVPASIPS